MTALDLLYDAWSLIEDEDHWTQKYGWRDAAGHGTSVPESAVSFCSVGAVEMAYRGHQGQGGYISSVYHSLGFASESLYGVHDLVYINDRMTHADVERLFALAAAYLSEGAHDDHS